MEELQEADVLWPEQDIRLCRAAAALLRPQCESSLNGSGYHAKETAPISIPNAASAGQHRPWQELAHRDGEDGNGGHDECIAGNAELVPPHVLVARRFSGKTFSMCTGQGRTLKGRDLSQVRNSILRLTGFLEG